MRGRGSSWCPCHDSAGNARAPSRTSRHGRPRQATAADRHPLRVAGTVAGGGVRKRDGGKAAVVAVHRQLVQVLPGPAAVTTTYEHRGQATLLALAGVPATGPPLRSPPGPPESTPGPALKGAQPPESTDVAIPTLGLSPLGDGSSRTAATTHPGEVGDELPLRPATLFVPACHPHPAPAGRASVTPALCGLCSARWPPSPAERPMSWEFDSKPSQPSHDTPVEASVRESVSVPVQDSPHRHPVVKVLKQCQNLKVVF